jgi:aspartyl-tRNA(Asn)/glutamyl-tRNA(Gln) amidotransferase subunit A
VYRSLRGDLQVPELANLPEGLRGGLLFSIAPMAGRPPRSGPGDANLPLPSGGWSPASNAFVEAYAKNAKTPVEIVERCIALARELAQRTPSAGPILFYSSDAMAEAEASRERYRAGKPLGPLDGVPFIVKEQSAVRALPRQNGTRFIKESPMEADAACVAPLRAAGAIVLGTSPMTELGLSPLGQNRHRTMPRNPYAPGHLAGGSSTGSGVAVGTGLVPFALGVDGGGSVRIPAAWNGVFGIKPTWGRISRTGTFAEGSMSHVGPIANNTVDLARTLELMSARDPSDVETLAAPPVARGAFEAALRRGVRGLRIGVEEREWADAAPEVERAGRDALRALEREGAVLVPIRLELARYSLGIGVLSIGPEARALYRRDIQRFTELMSYEVQISFAGLSQVTSSEYLDAQRLRTGLRAEIAHAFGDVDLIAMPTTADPPPAVTDGEMASGFVDARALGRACRYVFLANLTGLPAGTAPVGRATIGKTATSLPVGFQLVGDAWDEPTVLAALAHLERIGAAEVSRPSVSVDVLS